MAVEEMQSDKRMIRQLEKQILALLKAIHDCRDQLKDGRNDEALHDYRVGTRKLCSILKPFIGLDGFGDIIKPLKHLKRCLRESNAVRDLEVQIALMRPFAADNADAACWLDEHEAKLGELLQTLILHLESKRISQANQQLKRTLPEALSHHSQHTLRAAARAEHTAVLMHVSQYLDLGEAIFDDANRWHALRLTCKRLRYLCECHGNLLGQHWQTEANFARSVQNALGDLRDVDQLLIQLQHTKSLPHIQSSLATQRDQLLKEAHGAVAAMAGYVYAPFEFELNAVAVTAG